MQFITQQENPSIRRYNTCNNTIAHATVFSCGVLVIF